MAYLVCDCLNRSGQFVFDRQSLAEKGHDDFVVAANDNRAEMHINCRTSSINLRHDLNSLDTKVLRFVGVLTECRDVDVSHFQILTSHFVELTQ